MFQAQIQAYIGEIQGESSRIDAENRIFNSQIERERARTAVYLKNAEISLQNAQNTAALVGDLAKNGATVSAQMAASAWSAINVQSQTSGSDSTNTNYNYSL